MSTQSAAVRDWTYAEFARLPDDGNRYEVIAGALNVTPSPSTTHQEAAARLFLELRLFATRQHKLGKVLSAPIDILLGSGDYLVPDLVFIRAENRHYETSRGIEGPPDLVVEVLSRATALRDRGVKRERYAAYGVPEYWIVDVAGRRVEVYRLQEDPDRPAIVSGRLPWQPVPGGPILELDLEELFGDLGAI